MASMTKPMTAVSVLMLMEEGKLVLERSGFEIHSGVQESQSRGLELAERS